MKVYIENGVLTGMDGFRGGEYTTPEGVTVVGGGSPLDEYMGPDKFIISEGVTEIGVNAFFLSGVLTVVLPESLIRIRDGAFSCSAVRHYILPDKPIAVGTQAFYGYPDGGAAVTIRRAKDKGGDLDLTIDMSNWEHIDFHYIMKMIVERDFSQKVAPMHKNPIAARMCLAGIPEAEDYVKRGFSRIFKSLCSEENEQLAVALIETHRYVTKKNIDKLTEYAFGRSAVLAALDKVRGKNTEQ